MVNKFTTWTSDDHEKVTIKLNNNNKNNEKRDYNCEQPFDCILIQFLKGKKQQQVKVNCEQQQLVMVTSINNLAFGLKLSQYNS